MISIKDYKHIVGEEKIEEIKELSNGLVGRHITNINATASGGGVAEILNSLVLLLNELNINVGWRLIKGNNTFFNITKGFHNAMQGENYHLTSMKKEIYQEEVERNAIMNHFWDHDLVIVHDPQPLAMINYYKKRRQPWVWRCHIDITKPNKDVWKYLSNDIKKYDGMIVSMRKYKKKSLKIPQFIIYPSIDPLSLKNKEIGKSARKKILSKAGIDLDKPILTQISRFDKWKNPLGVIKIFEEAQKKTDAKLVLMGDMASDDPEGPKIYQKVFEKCKNNKDIIMLTNRDDALVNCLQRDSHVVIQNSSKEGFGLTVTEALWKRTPVVTPGAGGIPLQVINGGSGFIINSNQEAAKRCVQLIENDKLREDMGNFGRQHVLENFLITRHVKDYLNLFDYYINMRN